MNAPHRLSGWRRFPDDEEHEALLRDNRDRFEGPPRSYRIGAEPRIGWAQVAVMGLVAAFIGFALAVQL